ncbi:hypothetical protein LF887_13885 [Chryseobacterium sp. MEBOG06]|uniref:hypothetical protein n=1 Tax=Chryseobacterium sp. MEBOG06 TaxID=2879938 RepID=UPI001F1BDD2C|nr:hypothetical protein [Chryseobacterium sp. MEBOG06]UKB82097.1 hypothetical protein LF887_13885 [Chryseobacterium sp. MEBOG06]
MIKIYAKLCLAVLALSPAIIFAQAGNVGVNTANPGSTMDINGSLAANYKAVTTSYNLTSSDFHISYGGTADTVFSLPVSISGDGNFKGRIYRIKNNSNFKITVNAAAPETINGNISISVPANQSVELVSTGLSGANSTWEILSMGTIVNNNMTASNGLTVSGTDVKLGGTLSQASDIATAGNNLSISGTGKVLVGTNAVPAGAASAKIVIDNGTTNGALQIKDGTQQLGYVLTSDANGLATWSSTVTTAFANNWTPYAGTLVNPYTGGIGAAGLNTGVQVTIPAKGWYFFRCGIAINSDCNDYFFYINGIGDVWRSYCGSNTAAFIFPRDQNRVLYFAVPGTYNVLAGKTNGIVPVSFNAGNPSFYLDFVKFQN